MLKFPSLKFSIFTYFFFLNHTFLLFSFRQIEVHSIEEKNHPNLGAEEVNGNDSITLPQQRNSRPDLPNQRVDNEELEQRQEQWNTGGDVVRSQSIRSGLTLNLSNDIHRGQSGHMLRTRSSVPAGSISPSIISSLISLEAFDANKKKQQHSTDTCSANVQAQVY